MACEIAFRFIAATFIRLDARAVMGMSITPLDIKTRTGSAVSFSDPEKDLTGARLLSPVCENCEYM
jgi:hypothetical protein